MTAYVPLNAFLPYLAAGWTFAGREATGGEARR